MMHRILIVPTTHEEFVRSCRSIAVHSPSVSIDPERLAAIAPLLKGADCADWGWYLPPTAVDLPCAVREFAFNAALNGGYFAETERGIEQWAIRGSGSQALLQWIAELRKERLMPGDGLLGNSIAEKAYRKHLDGLPHPAERLEIVMSFATAEGLDKLNEITRRIQDEHAAAGAYRFSMDHVNHLTRLFPAAFGGDPFREKAILAFLMLAGWLHHHSGQPVAVDVPAAAGYQIPRILAWKGVIRVSDELDDLIRDDRHLLDVDCEPVTAFRAAAVVVAHDIAQLAGVPDFVVDGVLFSTFRKNAGFQANALPPMRCASMWF